MPAMRTSGDASAISTLSLMHQYSEKPSIRKLLRRWLSHTASDGTIVSSFMSSMAMPSEKSGMGEAGLPSTRTCRRRMENSKLLASTVARSKAPDRSMTPPSSTGFASSFGVASAGASFFSSARTATGVSSCFSDPSEGGRGVTITYTSSILTEIGSLFKLLQGN